SLDSATPLVGGWRRAMSRTEAAVAGGTRRRTLALAVPLAGLAAGLFLPPLLAGLPLAGQRALIVTLITILLWTGELLEPDVAALGELDAEVAQHPRALGPEEPHREQDQVHLQRELASRDRLELQPTALAHEVDPHGFESTHVAARVAEEALRRDRVDALAALLVRTRHAEDVGPLGPGVVRGARVGRPRQELELVDGERALAVHGAEAVGARVASADDDDALALGRDEFLVGDQVTLAALVLERQVFHREVD